MKSIVRTSCLELINHPDCLTSIDESRIKPFLESIDKAHYTHILKQEAAQLKFPLIFDSDEQRWNFYAILHLLNFASGYRIALKQANGAGAFDNIIKLLITLHLSGQALDAKWMRTIDAASIGEMMRLPMTVDLPVEKNPALKQVVPSPVSKVAHKIAEALNSTGEVLEQRKCRSLIDFVQEGINRSKDINELMSNLSTIPTLADRHSLHGVDVYIYKKMQVMISELKRQGLSIPCLQEGDLTVFSDNVLPT